MVIVKKTYPKFRNRQKCRFWKLKHFAKEEEAVEEENQVPIDPEDQEEYTRLRQKQIAKVAKKPTSKQVKQMDRKDVQKG